MLLESCAITCIRLPLSFTKALKPNTTGLQEHQERLLTLILRWPMGNQSNKTSVFSAVLLKAT